MKEKNALISSAICNSIHLGFFSFEILINQTKCILRCLIFYSLSGASKWPSNLYTTEVVYNVVECFFMNMGHPEAVAYHIL